MQLSFKGLWKIPYRLKYSGNTSNIFQRHLAISFCRDHQTTASPLQVYDSHFPSCRSCANPRRRITFANVTSSCDTVVSFRCTLPGAKIRFAGSYFFPRLPCHSEKETNCNWSLLDSFAFASLYNRLGMMDNVPVGQVSEFGIANGESDAIVAVYEQSERKDEGFIELAADKKDIPVNQDSPSSFAKRTDVDVLHEGKIKEIDGSSPCENENKAQSGEDLQLLLEVDNCNFIETRVQRAESQTTMKFEYKDNDGMAGADRSEYREPKGSTMNSDKDSFGLETLFDEDLQCKDASRWTSQTKKKCTKREKRKRKRTLDVSNEESGVVTSVESADGSTSPKERKRSKNLVPNYFVAIRISNPEIHSGIKMVQDSILAHNKKLKPTVIPLSTLHLTLMVMHLEGEEQIQKAREILDCCKENVMPILENRSLTLRFSGLGHFRHQVLYSKVSNQEEITILKKVVNVVRETFANGEIPSTDSRDFEPHLTLLKLSRKPGLRKKGIKNIPAESYSDFVDTTFGEEDVNALHLCSMNQKDKDGFYKCVSTVEFGTDLGNPPCSKPTGNLVDAGDDKKQAPHQVGVSAMETEAVSRENHDTCLEYENSEILLSNQDVNNSTSTPLSDLSWELVTWSEEDKVEYEVHMGNTLCEGNQKHLRKRKRCMVM